MASTYALPVSAMPSSHGHGHGHVHSHSHTPSFSPSKLGPGGQRPATGSRTLPQERSNGSLHNSAYAESSSTYEGIHEPAQSLEPFRANVDLLPRPSNNNLALGGHYVEKSLYDAPPAYSQPSKYEASTGSIDHIHHGHDHGDNAHSHHNHTMRGHSHVKIEKPSSFTSLLLPYTENWTLLHSILKEKDSRRIFYFMTVNFLFMIIQAVYGFLTDSLGLLSDSIHMFFDCLALALGLFAAVSSKWPASERFPYGFGKIESLSGFGNGVFLMLISIEILIEAMERLAEGRETKRLTELLIVSSLGLAVNLVGMAFFGHHHHGGDHSHGHNSTGDHCNHDHDHDHKHNHPDTTPLAASSHSHGHSAHSHDNENMRGIFLHVLADTMGSAAVIVSTLLIKYVGWSGWDPLASCIIAVLIFMSSIPLVSSSAQKLLLTVSDDTEYQLRQTLAGVSDLRGVANYTVPRFWMADNIPGKKRDGILGVMHIIATRGSDLEDVRERARAYLLSHGMDVVLQVEREGDLKCWCGGSSRSPSSSGSRFS